MPRRTIRVTIRRQVTIKRTFRLQQQTRITPIVPPRPVPQRLTTSASVLSTPLSRIRRAAADYIQEAEGVTDEDRQYDVFVAHASEDQAEVVRPLVTLLEQQHGLEVWYSESVLRPGASLRRSIDAGLRNSRFGIVVLSQSFFAKEWPNRELDGLVTRSVVEGRQLILPIWHNVTTAEVTRYSAPLADKLALSTAKIELAEIAREIAEAVRS